FTKTYGYVLVTKRSKTLKEGGSIRRVYLQCSRREVYCERTNEETYVCWRLDRTDPRHDYYSAARSTLASLRHEGIESKETQIKSYLDSYMSINQILSTLYKDNLKLIAKPRDIYNKKKKSRDDFLNSKTPVQALISVVLDDGFGFISDEKEGSYKFILECLVKVYAQADLPLPNCILTNKDMALMNAIPTVFPMANNTICLWHIEKNILTRARPILTNE
ncbi:hypothetical protein TSTA_091410, partial [Talaromyces stipitatus ATCC 10500]